LNISPSQSDLCNTVLTLRGPTLHQTNFATSRALVSDMPKVSQFAKHAKSTWMNTAEYHHNEDLSSQTASLTQTQRRAVRFNTFMRDANQKPFTHKATLSSKHPMTLRDESDPNLMLSGRVFNQNLRGSSRISNNARRRINHLLATPNVSRSLKSKISEHSN
jgi:hypothetical protein